MARQGRWAAFQLALENEVRYWERAGNATARADAEARLREIEQKVR